MKMMMKKLFFLIFLVSLVGIIVFIPLVILAAEGDADVYDFKCDKTTAVRGDIVNCQAFLKNTGDKDYMWLYAAWSETTLGNKDIPGETPEISWHGIFSDKGVLAKDNSLFESGPFKIPEDLAKMYDKIYVRAWGLHETDTPGVWANYDDRETITITLTEPAALKITSTSQLDPSAKKGKSYKFTFSATGGTLPYTWSSADPPSGLTLSSEGVLSGTPDVAGTPTFTVEVKDSKGVIDKKDFKLTILSQCADLKGVCCAAPTPYCLEKHKLEAWDCECCDNITNCTSTPPPIFVLPPGIIKIENPLMATSFEEIIDGILDFIFKIAMVLAPLMIVVGGLLFVTAAGNLEQIDRAKKLILWTIIGFIIILLSKGLLAIIEQLLGVKS